jgi:hemolysin activation/secretion protein
MMNHKILSLVLISLLILLPNIATGLASPRIPPAGVVERQIEQEYEAEKIEAEKAIPLLEIDIPEDQLDVGDEKVSIEEVSFSGNEVFATKELIKIIAPYLGQLLSMKEIREMCALIQKKYVKSGYFLTRAYTPAQEIQDGHLKISILEGKLGEIMVKGNKHYSDDFIRSYFERFRNRAINYDQFLKELLLLSENMDLDVAAIFMKGHSFGTTDVLLQVKDNRPIHLSLDTNNYGSDNTSQHRTGAKLDWGSLIRYGDTLTVIEVVGSPITSLDFTDAIYYIPVNTRGSGFELSYLLANFKTGNVGEDIKFEGKTHIAAAKFIQAINRTRKLSTDFFTSFEYKQIQNLGSGLQSSFDKLRVLTGGMNIDYRDEWSGRNLFAGYMSWGIPDILQGMAVDDSESSRQGAGGRFVKIGGSGKRFQKLPWDCVLILNGFGQYSFNKLPLPEQIYIGGVDTVRGYKLAEGLGDQGFVCNLEFRVPPPFLRGHRALWSKKRWGELVHFVGFLDHGQTFSIGVDKIKEVTRNREGQKQVTPVPQVKRPILTSAGVGIRIYGPWRFDFSFDAGYPLTQKFRSSDTIVYFKVGLQIL